MAGGEGQERFRDRVEAGRRLAAELGHLRGEDVVVFGLPRGGVPVAHQVARALGVPLDIVVVRKLGAPGQPELAMGAIGLGDVRVLNASVVRALSVSDKAMEETVRRETAELRRREQEYRGHRPFPELAGRTAVLVDDGVATGSTAKAGIRLLRANGAGRIILAVPVVPAGSIPSLREDVDELVYVMAPQDFGAVGYWYEDFRQTDDDEVRTLLQEAHAPEVTP